jgi:flagellar basal body-associated protein FliL
MGARVLIPFLVLSNAAVAAGMVKMMRSGAQAAPTSSPADSDDDPDRHFLLQFVVRVRTRHHEDRYVRTAFDLLLARSADREVLQASLPKIRDAVLGYYLDHTFDELTGSAGIERTKRAVRERVERIARRPVQGIFLVDLVMM